MILITDLEWHRGQVSLSDNCNEEKVTRAYQLHKAICLSIFQRIPRLSGEQWKLYKLLRLTVVLRFTMHT